MQRRSARLHTAILLLLLAPPAGAAPAAPPATAPPTAKAPGRGVTVATADGRLSLTLRARVQARYDAEVPHAPGTKASQTVQLRRVRLVLQGHAWTPHCRYYLQLAFAPRDQLGGLAAEDGSIRRNPLRDARLEFDRWRDLTLWVGQMKVPFSRERVMSSATLNLVDRSPANEEFNLDRDLGLQLLSRDFGGRGWFGYSVGVFGGQGRNAYQPSRFGMLYAARVEARPLGAFEDYAGADLAREPQPRLGIGVAYAFQDQALADRGVFGERFTDGGTSDFHHATADLVLKWRGWALQSALHWRHGFHRHGGGALDDEGAPVDVVAPRSGLGAFAQLGWLPLAHCDLELVVRYALTRDPYHHGLSSLPQRDEATLGVNYYFAQHDLKLQLDYARVFDDTMAPKYWDALTEGTDRVRMQLQLGF
jgi:phosphate-selective porin OprO/OprP